MNMSEFMSIDFSQIYRLKSMLEEAKIPFEFVMRPESGGYQIIYPNEKTRDCSVILHAYSYGHECGLLEIMGLLTEEESQYDDVVGFLSAEDVFARIVNDWNIRKESN